MDTELLRTFLMVAHEGNFTRAAERAYVTQPTLSRRISQLEDYVGAELFSRGSAGVALTPAGKALEAEAQEIVRRVDMLPSLIKESSSEGGGHDEHLLGPLNVMTHAMLGDGLVQEFIAALQKRHPYLNVNLGHAYPTEIRRGLAAGKTDVGFFLRPMQSSTSGMETVRVGASVMMVVVNESHPFACRDSVEIDELRDADIIMLERSVSPQIVDFINAQCYLHGFSLKASRYVRDIDNALILASAGRGVTFIHSMMPVTGRLGSMGVRAVRIAGTDMNIDYVARVREGLPNDLYDAVMLQLRHMERKTVPQAVVSNPSAT